MAIILSDNLNVATNAPVDVKYGPYIGANEAAAILAANNALSSGVRFEGLTVGLIIGGGSIEEYWYQGGIANNNLVEKGSSTGGASTMAQVYAKSTATTTGEIAAADYQSLLKLCNESMTFSTNNTTNTPSQSTVPRTSISSSTSSTSKAIEIYSTTNENDDDTEERGKIYINAENASANTNASYYENFGRVLSQTYGPETSPESSDAIVTPPNDVSGSGVAITSRGGDANWGVVKLITENSCIPDAAGDCTGEYNKGFIEVVSPQQPFDFDEAKTPYFSVGTDRFFLNNSAKTTNTTLLGQAGDIVQIKKFTAKFPSQEPPNQIEIQSICPTKFVNATLGVDRLKSPTMIYEAGALVTSVTLNIENVRNGQYGTLYIGHLNSAFNITLGTVNGDVVKHKVVNNQQGTLPVTANPAEEVLVFDVYTYLYIEEDDAGTNHDVVVWTYGLNYT